MVIDVIELFEGRAEGIERILKKNGVEYQLVRPYEIELLSSYNNPLILSGGKPSLLQMESYPYLRGVIRYVSDAIKKDTPILGICLGHQVIAKALGGKIRHSESPEYGFRSVVHNENELTKGIKPPFLVFQYHGDEVTSLPPNTTIFSSNDSTQIQGFVVDGKKVYGIQYHPEVDLALAQRILVITPTQKLTGSLPLSSLSPIDILGDLIVENFLEVIGNEK